MFTSPNHISEIQKVDILYPDQNES